MVSSGISDEVVNSVHSENTRLKKLMKIIINIIIIITMNKSQFFSEEINSAMKLRRDKFWKT